MSFYKDDFDIKLFTKAGMPLNKEIKPNLYLKNNI